MAFVELGFFFVSSICTKKVILSFFPVRFTSVFFFFYFPLPLLFLVECF